MGNEKGIQNRRGEENGGFCSSSPFIEPFCDEFLGVLQIEEYIVKRDLRGCSPTKEEMG